MVEAAAVVIIAAAISLRQNINIMSGLIVIKSSLFLQGCPAFWAVPISTMIASGFSCRLLSHSVQLVAQLA